MLYDLKVGFYPAQEVAEKSDHTVATTSNLGATSLGLHDEDRTLVG
jgi:hypothetical protein